MNFFENPDWFGRPGPFAYNLEYIVFMVLAIAFVFVLPILLKGKDKKIIKLLLIILWGVAVVLDILKYGYLLISNAVNGTFTIANIDVPLWTCSMFLYLMPFVLFCKTEKVQRACTAFICTISLFAGLVNFAVPAEESLFSFFGLHKMVYHYILLLTPAIMLGTGFIKLNLKDLLPSMIVLVIFAVPVYVFNAIFKQDYMFIYDGSFLPFDASSISSVSKLLYTLLALIAYAVLALMVIGIDMGVRKLHEKIKKAK